MHSLEMQIGADELTSSTWIRLADPVHLTVDLLNAKSIDFDMGSRTTTVPSFKSFRSWVFVFHANMLRPSAPSSVISRPTCFSSIVYAAACRWAQQSAPSVRRRCDCLASSAPFTNIQTYLLTYLHPDTHPHIRKHAHIHHDADKDIRRDKTTFAAI